MTKTMNSRLSIAWLIVLGIFQLVGLLLTAGSALGWESMILFRYLSDPLFMGFNNPELNLLLGITAYLISTFLAVAALETKLRSRGSSGRAALSGILPLAGVLLFFLASWEKGTIIQDGEVQSEGQLVPTAIVLGLAGLMLVCGVYFVTQIGKPRELAKPISAAQGNLEAFSAIKTIGKAQASYKQRDWDGDGEKEFAPFVVHLWRTGRLRKEPVDVKLIPEELAVARVEALAFRGYCFRNLHFQELERENAPEADLAQEPPLRQLDYRKEWALIAEPQFFPKESENNYSLKFLALSDGRIFATPHEERTVQSIPSGYEKNWSPVSSVADLEKAQKKSRR